MYYIYVFVILFIFSYYVGKTLVNMLPAVIIYPSEQNLYHIYTDDNNICYKYERQVVECD